MAGQSQKINNFLLGFSDQPDELKPPGVVRDAVNVFPDVTFGLLKRPGFNLINKLDNADKDGKWFSYYRTNNFPKVTEKFGFTGDTEEYIGNISQSGDVRMYNAVTGEEILVEFSDAVQYDYRNHLSTPRYPDLLRNAVNIPYFKHDFRQDLQTTTVNDFTFVVNRTVFPKMKAPEFDGIDKYHAFIDMTVVAYGRKYQLTFDVNGTEYKPVFATPTDGSTQLDADAILDDLVKDINDDVPGVTATKIGSGIYCESDDVFTIETPTTELFDILAPFSDEIKLSDTETKIAHWTSVNNVTELPTQCKDGLICQVANTDSDRDDYYLKFYGSEGDDGTGVWEETVRPGLRNTFDETTLPYQIVRQPIVADPDQCEFTEDNITGIKFVISPISWESRLVGDEETNPRPSWAPTFEESKKCYEDAQGRPINKILFFQNRLVTLTDENIVMSQSDDIFNFWAFTALTVSDIDVIDVRASNTYASVLTDGIVLTNGLLLFSAFQQFLVSTQNDTLAPDKIKIRSLSSYDYNTKTTPFKMGSSVGFVSEAGQNSRFYEMPEVFQDQDPRVLENSRTISRRFPRGIEFAAVSKEDGLITFLQYDKPEIFAFRYFDNNNERLQAAWFKFTLHGNAIFHDIIEENYYVIQEVDGDIWLTSMNLRDRQTTTSVTGEEYFYRVNLDFKENVSNVQKSGGKTTFDYTGPIITDKISEKKLYAVKLVEDSNGNQDSLIQPVKYENNTFSVSGDWTGSGDLAVGYVYEYKVELPHFFIQEKEGNFFKSQTANSLTLHRIHMNFGPTGYFKTTLKRLGRDDYTVEYESLPQDITRGNALPFVPEKIQTISIYDRNTNINLFLTSEHPAPCTLWSATWEGDYTQRYYKRG